jgi:hypothetical protein
MIVNDIQKSFYDLLTIILVVWVLKHALFRDLFVLGHCFVLKVLTVIALIVR